MDHYIMDRITHLKTGNSVFIRIKNNTFTEVIVRSFFKSQAFPYACISYHTSKSDNQIRWYAFNYECNDCFCTAGNIVLPYKDLFEINKYFDTIDFYKLLWFVRQHNHDVHFLLLNEQQQ